MSNNLSLVTTGLTEIRPFAVSAEAIRQKDAILADCALIGKVANADQNTTAVKAMQSLQGLSNALERDRKKLKEPLLDAGRQLDNAVNTVRTELDRERGRIECLVKDFALVEQRRAAEEQERQRLELERLDREKQRLLERAKTPEAKAAIEEVADAKAAIIAMPVEPQRQTGQTNRKVWKITQINDFQLVKARPDLVRKIEWDMVAIKQLLDQGVKLPGVTAEEDLRIGVRGKLPATVEV